MSVAFVVFTDYESCTRPIPTNPASMEAGQYGLTRVTCFLPCRLELDAVAGLLWISWCVLGGGADFSPFFFVRFFFFERTGPAASMRPPPVSFTSLLVVPGFVQGSVINWSVCVCMCVQHSSFLLIARAARGRFSKTRKLWKRVSMG